MRNFFLSLLLAIFPAVPAWAGGGPENVFLVVNPQSTDSLTIANEYQRLRHIPPGNIFYLPWDPKSEEVSVDDFRNLIMKPILDAVRLRRLTSQIDYVIYSSGYPTCVNLQNDVNKFKTMPAIFKVKGIRRENPPVISGPTTDEWKTAEEFPKQIGVSPECSPTGSLNGMTFLLQWTMRGEPDYLTWQCNRYMRMPIPEQKETPSLGFRSSWQFGASGELVEKDGASYLLSTMLGVTSGRGNSVEEVLKYLDRSATADGTHPHGTIYFMKNDDVRSKVRDRLFPETIRELEKLGIDAKIVPGTVPLNRRDVQGVCMGTADFDWKASGSTIRPGALCEHYTSFGGILRDSKEQTPLSEFLRYGAAGASGTVVEPYAVWQKFPLPQIQVHYARGCSLAEAFYQSVYGPYQLLIVGDPLCRPWANIPHVEADGIENGSLVKGDLTLTPKGTVPHGGKIDRFELFVNGARAAQCKPGETLKLDTTLVPDGFQEIRIVAVENSAIQSQGRAIYSIVTENYGRKIEVSAEPNGTLKNGDMLKIKVKSPGSLGIGIMQNSRIVGRIAGEEGTAEIAAAKLGSGKVQLQAVGIGKTGPKSHVLSKPIDVEIELKKQE